MFPGAKTERVQALITADGMKAFEARRLELAKLSGWKLGDISDAAVVEYLARGKKLKG